MPIVTDICTVDITEIIIKPKILEIVVSPNPFNSSVAITAPAGAAIKIYDLRGNVVYVPSPGSTVSSHPLPQAGEGKWCGDENGGQKSSFSLDEGEGGAQRRMREIVWQPDQTIASGIYLVRASLEEQTIVKRVAYLK